MPIGDGWWGAGEKLLNEDETVYKFVVETSVEEIQVGSYLITYGYEKYCMNIILQQTAWFWLV